MARYYVDTAIFRDYCENRVDRFRPLGEWALAFFKKVEHGHLPFLLYRILTSPKNGFFTAENAEAAEISLGLCQTITVFLCGLSALRGE